MLTIFLLFLVVSSGSFFASTHFNKKYEELVPLTIFSIVFILYVFGLIGYLTTGVYLVYILTFFLFILSFIKFHKSKNKKQVLLNVFTPAFFIFFIITLILIWGNYNRLAYSWDEFSHWADIVKVMYTINDFGTSPLSFSAFQSYPPAMSLFQYFTLVLHGTFKEWLLYVSYQMFALSLFLPFLKNLNYKNIWKAFLILILILSLPIVFYESFYNGLYIDAFLGLLFGFALANIYASDKFDWANKLTTMLAMFVLVLTKQAGLLFAGISLIVFTLDVVSSASLNTFRALKKHKLELILIAAALGIIIFAKISWDFNIKFNNANLNFSNPIDIKEFFFVITQHFLGRSVNYRSEVLSNFIAFIFTSETRIGVIKIFNYQIIVIAMFGLYFMNSVYKKLSQDKLKIRSISVFVIGFSIVFYFFGLLASYMFKFSEYEAVRLASFQRYANIIYTAVIAMIFMVLLLKLTKYNKNFKAIPVLIFILLFTTPYMSFYSFISRSNTLNSISVRSPYEKLSKEVNGLITKEKAKVFIISQGDSGFDYWVMRYSIRPNQLSGWSLGDPAYNGSIYNQNITALEWKNRLKESFDYVILYKIDDYFMENYESVFKNASEIQSKKIYQVDKSSGLLSALD